MRGTRQRHSVDSGNGDADCRHQLRALLQIQVNQLSQQVVVATDTAESFVVVKPRCNCFGRHERLTRRFNCENGARRLQLTVSHGPSV